MNNKRTPLANKSKINLDDMEIVIGNHIGSGGTCLVYEATWNNCPVIVKEFYPSDLNLNRNGDNSLNIPDDKVSAFERERAGFEAGQSLHTKFYGNSEKVREHSLPINFKYSHFNNTSYAVSYPGAGSVMTDIDRKDLSLYRVAKIMISVCAAISAFHERRCLYMDIKPDNFFYMHSETAEQIYVCDFDTVTPMDRIKRRNYDFCSYSLGWAAPEQMPDEEGLNYANPKMISYSSDIFSIGAVFFWLLTGRRPEISTDIMEIKSKSFDWRKNSAMLGNHTDEAVNKINSICELILEPVAAIRKDNYCQKNSILDVMDEFKVLARYAEEKQDISDPLYNHIVSTERTVNTIATTTNEITEQISLKMGAHFSSIKAQIEAINNGSPQNVTDTDRIKAIQAYSQVWTSIDKLFLRPELMELKPFFYERSTELPPADYIDLGLALSLRIRDGIQYSSALLCYMPEIYQESHYKYQRQIMSSEITKRALDCYKFEWENNEKPLIDKGKVQIDSIVAYSKYWTDVGELFLQKDTAVLRKYFFELSDRLPDTRKDFESAKIIAEIYRDTMMYSELLLDSIPFEFRRSYNVFKRRIMEAEIMKASINDYQFRYEEEQGY